MIADAGGASLGLWEFGVHTGYQLVAESGAPAWHELLTREFAAAVKFYLDVMGWETTVLGDTDEFRYSTLGEGDQAKAGIMDAGGVHAGRRPCRPTSMPADVPANWHVYCAVEIADAAKEAALARGGALVWPAEDTPFGRNAMLTDPTGAESWITQDIRQG